MDSEVRTSGGNPDMPWTRTLIISLLGGVGAGSSDHGVSRSIVHGHVSTDPPHLPNVVALLKVPFPQQDIVGDW
jgi:hypothetical protein